MFDNVVDFFEREKIQGFLTFGNDGDAGRIPKTSESLEEGNAFRFFPLIDCKQKIRIPSPTKMQRKESYRFPHSRDSFYYQTCPVAHILESI